jgi:hypothetical protein
MVIFHSYVSLPESNYKGVEKHHVLTSCTPAREVDAVLRGEKLGEPTLASLCFEGGKTMG